MKISNHDWTKSPRISYFYRTGSRILRNEKLCVIIILISIVLIFVYMCPSIYNSICFHTVDSSKSFCNVYNYNRTYPITKPVRKGDSITYRVAIISDLDKRSKAAQESNRWFSIMRTGYLMWVPTANVLFVTWDKQDIILSSSLSMKGRGMECSELVTFDGHLLTFDDRTGIVFIIENNEIYPWVILMDGNGKSVKGFKSEWAAVKDGQLYVGSMGKEWTTSSGEWQHNNPLWIKVITPRGEIRSIDWTYNYKKLRNTIGIKFPGYMIHESGLWSVIHNCWFFLPRRCSNERYNETLDETRSCNILLKANENFSDIKVTSIGTKTPTKGFSSFKFLPGSQENIIVALKSEEYQNQMATYILAFTIDGDIIMPEQRIALEKFEGFEFV